MSNKPQHPILYANADSLIRNPPSLVVTNYPTTINSIPYIPAESTKPLHVALLAMSDTLTRLLNLWTEYSDINASSVNVKIYEKLDAEMSAIRTAYLKAKSSG